MCRNGRYAGEVLSKCVPGRLAGGAGRRGGPPTSDPRVQPEPVTRHGRTMIPLTRRPGGLQAYKMIVEPGERQHDQQSHEGYEWMYVLNGRLRLMLGELDIVLCPGEVAEFDTHTPHWFGSAGH